MSIYIVIAACIYKDVKQFWGSYSDYDIWTFAYIWIAYFAVHWLK